MSKIDINKFVHIQASLAEVREQEAKLLQERDALAQEIGKAKGSVTLTNCPGFNGEEVKVRQVRGVKDKFYLYVPSENVKPEAKPVAKKSKLDATSLLVSEEPVAAEE